MGRVIRGESLKIQYITGGYEAAAEAAAFFVEKIKKMGKVDVKKGFQSLYIVEGKIVRYGVEVG